MRCTHSYMMLSITDHEYTVVVVFKLVHRVKVEMHNFDFCLNKITCSLVYSVMNRLGNNGNFNLKQGLHYFLLGILEQVLR
jgi:predicted component of type VI protein secretion system